MSLYHYTTTLIVLQPQHKATQGNNSSKHKNNDSINKNKPTNTAVSPSLPPLNPQQHNTTQHNTTQTAPFFLSFLPSSPPTRTIDDMLEASSSLSLLPADEHPAAMHTGRGASADPLPAWGVMLVVCLVLIASRSPQGGRLNLHHVLPHVLASHTGGGGREGDKESRAGHGGGGAALGRVDTCICLTSAPKDSFRFYSLRGRRRPVHASCQRAVLGRAIDSHPATPPHCSLLPAPAPAPR